eukprot:CAMPEP_0181050392 /NCGR_PEP_ID=MMETSP1070-20121207/16492_1 /TAXON_ID=265543 /ORGANISM="Minutocellus polymorphus, Strain NH13" /LENGTH=412 /DNA_ID=CAMNT_0023129335 /DNA_START=115 /DNA_END=1350 /DNA_ORIENTATION=+
MGKVIAGKDATVVDPSMMACSSSQDVSPPWGSSYILPALGTIVLLKLFLAYFLSQKHTHRRGKAARDDLLRHAVVTGGSSGIGLAIARELALNKGCKHVTLLARKVDGLQAAKDGLEKELLATGVEQKLDQIVSIKSVNVTDYDAVSKAAGEICRVENGGPPSLLFNVAGTSSSGRFVETSPKEFERLMRINYLGTAHVTRAFLPHMLGNKADADPAVPPKPSTVVFTSSAAGQVGVYGYGAYSPTKAALRAMAECLSMEVPSSVAVQVAYPPDTDTPGYEAEQVGKPKETHLISEAAGLYQPSDVAGTMVDAALASRPRHTVYFGLEGWMLSTLTAGMGPPHGILDLICQVLLMGVFRFISLFYLWDFRRIINRCRTELEGGEITGNGVGGLSEENSKLKGDEDGGYKAEW